MTEEKFNHGFKALAEVLSGKPDAAAEVHGDASHAGLCGIVLFFSTPHGVLVAAEVKGLPTGQECESSVFGFHIHSGATCSGSAQDPFADTGAHFDMKNCPHPSHSGDMPPLFGNRGFAASVFLTDRVKVSEIIGRTVIIHSSADDFKTQPSGNSGTKIACGEIKAV